MVAIKTHLGLSHLERMNGVSKEVKETTENIGVCLSSKDLVGHQGKKGKEQSLRREKAKLMKEFRNVPGFIVDGGFSRG